MRNLTWLHISDVHFHPKTEWRDSAARGTLLSYLGEIYEKDPSLRPDLVFCTGDIAFGETGAASMADEYQQSETFFESLLNICGSLEKSRLFAIPGNHDVNRKLVDEVAQRGWTQSANESRKFSGKINQDFADLSIGIRRALERLQDYGTFVERFLPHQHDPNGRHCYAKVLEINGFNVGIAGFNSSWSCAGDSDRGTLWLPAEWQFNTLTRELSSADIRVGLMHHPIDWLNEYDQAVSKRRIESFDFWLTGHLHDPFVPKQITPIAIAAGAVGADTAEEFGINLVRLNLDRLSGTVYLHTYSPKEADWVPAMIGKRAPFGRCSIVLPDQAKKRVKQRLKPLSHPADPAAVEREQRIKRIGEALFAGFVGAIEALTDDAPNLARQSEATKIKDLLRRADATERTERRLGKVIDKIIQGFEIDTTSEFARRLEDYLSAAAENPATTQVIAATTLGMVRDDKKLLPEYLTQHLKVVSPEFFAKCLFRLRQNLFSEPGYYYHAAVCYANELEDLDRLSAFVNNLAEALDSITRFENYLRFECDSRKFHDEHRDTLQAYLTYLRKNELPHSPLPLTRGSTQTLTQARIKDIFVPIQVRQTSDESHGQKRTGTSKRQESSELGASPPASEETSLRRNDSDLGAVILNERTLVLLGPAGNGKTTLLKWVALALADGRPERIPGWNSRPGVRPQLLTGMVPIFFRLRSLGRYLHEQSSAGLKPQEGILSYLEYYYGKEHDIHLPLYFFNSLLNGGACCVFMDGLDELPFDQRELVAEHVEAFITRFSKDDKHPEAVGGSKSGDDPERDWANLFVLTSREKGYEAVKDILKKASLKVREIRPLEKDGIRELIENLLTYVVTDEKQRKKDIEELCNAIFRDSGLTILAGNPLFCTSLVLLYKHRGAELPQRRVDVFEANTELLLGFWKERDEMAAQAGWGNENDPTEASHLDLETRVENKKRRLSHIAFQMQLSGKRSQIDYDSLMEILSGYLRDEEGESKDRIPTLAKRFIANSQERSGLLIETESGYPSIYAFAHDGFREYLVAFALANLLDDDYINTILTNIDDPAWEEAIIMAATLRSLPGKRRGLLLDKCLNEARNCKSEGKFDEWLRRLTIAGRMARDMGWLLSLKDAIKLKMALLEAIRDQAAGLKRQNEIALMLDGLGWLTDTLSACLPIDRDGRRSLYIGKNLVANEQYQRFLNASDFGEASYWENPYCLTVNGQLDSSVEEARDWLSLNNKDNKRVPKSWNDPKFGIAHRGLPVVGISWYEANAYCRWLRKHWYELDEAKANPRVYPEIIRLPSDQEWSRAAFGNDNATRFPWQLSGSESGTDLSSGTYANIGKLLDQTSPVGMFNSGMSLPYGLLDACGNAWEWQANYFDRSYRAIAIRGGAFTTSLDDVVPALRGCRHPAERDNDIGFRILVEANET
jgi:formylglycine-generating enzyme required for sulfatase activity